MLAYREDRVLEIKEYVEERTASGKAPNAINPAPSADTPNPSKPSHSSLSLPDFMFKKSLFYGIVLALFKR